MKGRSMLLRMIWRAARVRWGRAATALAAVATAATVATALLTLYADSQAKLRAEFRNYGANVVIVAKDGAALPSDLTLPPGTTAVPYSYAVAHAAGNQPVVIAGTDLAAARAMNASWWSLRTVTAPASSQSFGAQTGETVSAIVGIRAAQALTANDAPFALAYNGKLATIVPTAVLQTGGAEDSRIYIERRAFDSWMGAPASAFELFVPGSAAEVRSAIVALSSALPAADVSPIRQIAEAQARVLGKTRSALLASTIFVIITAALCVLATLITWVLDRRRDFAVMKALGASDAVLKSFFAAESALLGAAGALIGFGIGLGVAALIARLNFHASITPRFSVLPPVLAGGVALALFAALVPVSLLRGIQPATMLKGE